MIVIADTSPLNYLILIGEVAILPQLYGRIMIPHAVERELLHKSAPPLVQSWIANPPEWLEIRTCELPVTTPAIHFGPGELEAMQLAIELSADSLIIDETLGRQEAMRRGLSVIGTLGVLRDAAKANLLDIHKAVAKLDATTFRLAPQTRAHLLGEFT